VLCPSGAFAETPKAPDAAPATALTASIVIQADQPFAPTSRRQIDYKSPSPQTALYNFPRSVAGLFCSRRKLFPI
jgi:hypothetical protein